MIANNELLKYYKELGCRGILVRVDGKAEGFTVGEYLNENMAVVHIEKASGSIHGLYTFLNQKFCELHWNEVEFVNREQDLGIEGLRRAKLSYHPAKMINKFIVDCG